MYSETVFKENLTEFLPEMRHLQREFLGSEESSRRTTDQLERIALLLEKHGLRTCPLGSAGFYVDVGHGAGPRLLLRFAFTEDPVAEPSSVLPPDHPFQLKNLCELLTGLSLAVFLVRNQEHMNRSVRILFQKEWFHKAHYAREIFSTLDAEHLEAVWGLHFNAALPEATVGVMDGAVFPGRYRFLLTIQRGESFERSHLNVINTAAQVISTLNQITSRKTDPLKPAHVLLSAVQSLAAADGTPQSVQIEGYLNIFEPADADSLLTLLEKTIAGTVKAFEMSCTLETAKVSEAVAANTDLCREMLACARESLGEQKVIRLEFPSKISADLAEVLRRLPGGILEVSGSPPEVLRRCLENPEDKGAVPHILAAVTVFSWNLLKVLRR